ncbi:UNKNOWN [Stylonychia lemnae]|uniref:Uncharacterized protein n=1 Tax=Stylonychia lemnae TaxID=5949 RepID=A0A078AG98_STYLE|nr:UNKNOWN [Stylonychia lemnae]|eukprot:CDW80856.1 UNKNOWN [Stylonychia lemnae]
MEEKQQVKDISASLNALLNIKSQRQMRPNQNKITGGYAMNDGLQSNHKLKYSMQNEYFGHNFIGNQLSDIQKQISEKYTRVDEEVNTQDPSQGTETTSYQQIRTSQGIALTITSNQKISNEGNKYNSFLSGDLCFYSRDEDQQDKSQRNNSDALESQDAYYNQNDAQEIPSSKKSMSMEKLNLRIPLDSTLFGGNNDETQKKIICDLDDINKIQLEDSMISNESQNLQKRNQQSQSQLGMISQTENFKKLLKQKGRQEHSVEPPLQNKYKNLQNFSNLISRNNQLGIQPKTLQSEQLQPSIFGIKLSPQINSIEAKDHYQNKQIIQIIKNQQQNIKPPKQKRNNGFPLIRPSKIEKDELNNNVISINESNISQVYNRSTSRKSINRRLIISEQSIHRINPNETRERFIPSSTNPDGLSLMISDQNLEAKQQINISQTPNFQIQPLKLLNNPVKQSISTKSNKQQQYYYQQKQDSPLESLSSTQQTSQQYQNFPIQDTMKKKYNALILNNQDKYLKIKQLAHQNLTNVSVGSSSLSRQGFTPSRISNQKLQRISLLRQSQQQQDNQEQLINSNQQQQQMASNLGSIEFKGNLSQFKKQSTFKLNSLINNNLNTNIIKHTTNEGDSFNNTFMDRNPTVSEKIQIDFAHSLDHEQIISQIIQQRKSTAQKNLKRLSRNQLVIPKSNTSESCFNEQLNDNIRQLQQNISQTINNNKNNINIL